MPGGRKSNDKSYINIPVTQRSLRDLDRHYHEVGLQLDKGVKRARTVAYFASALPGSDIESFYRSAKLEMGVHGKIYALCALFRHMQPKSKVLSVNEVAKQIFSQVSVKSSTTNSETGALVRLSDLQAPLRGLLSAGVATNYPDEKFAEIFLQLCTHGIARMLRHGNCEIPDDDKLYQKLSTLRVARPSECFRVLCETVGCDMPDGDENALDVHAFSAIDAVFQSYLDRDDKLVDVNGLELSDDATVLKLLEYIQAKSARRRLIVVTGEPFSGKKTLLVHLVRLIKQNNEGQLAVKLTNALKGRTELLPIFLVSAKALHYSELIANVLAFKRHIANQDLRPRPFNFIDVAAASENDIETNLRKIGEFKEPALFIFGDVGALDSDHTRNVVRDTGIKRLIEAILLSGDTRSRVLITTASMRDNAVETMRGDILPAKRFNMPRPTPRVLKHVNEHVKGWHHVWSLGANRQVNGSVLSAAAAMFSLAAAVRSDLFEVYKTFIFASQDEVAPQEAIYESLIAEIDRRNLLPAMALIASTTDYLSDATLVKLNKLAAGQSTQGEDDLALIAKLESFSLTTGSKFLLRRRVKRHDPEEYDFEEEIDARLHNSWQDGTEEVWEFDPEVSEKLIGAIQRKSPAVARTAARLISIAARRRSQNKKIRMKASWSSFASLDSARDIQCYINLLASINPTELTNLRHDYSAPLRTRERHIFTINADEFDVVTAVRFAALHLLHEEIDRDFRLSMVTDEDALRLDLYVLLFRELGSRHFAPSVSASIPTKFDDLPTHFRLDLFSPEELFGFLTTISLTAFHAQMPHLIESVVALATDLAGHYGLAPERKVQLMARIWCSEIDAEVLTGRKYSDILDKLGRKVKDNFTTLPDFNPDGLDDQTFVEKWPVIKARMRLMTRQAELLSLSREDRSVPTAAYEAIERVERRAARLMLYENTAVMNGRSARRYIRFLCRAPGLRTIRDQSAAPAKERAEIISRIERLIDINISRLRRFSGGDRIGVQLDIARLNFARGDIEVAIEYANEAFRRAFGGSLSLAGKADVLLVNADLNLLSLEMGDWSHCATDDRRVLGRIDLAHRQIDNLIGICESMSYTAYCGLAYYLRARLNIQRLFWASAEQGRREATVDAAVKDLEVAQASLEAVGDISFRESIADLMTHLQWEGR